MAGDSASTSSGRSQNPAHVIQEITEKYDKQKSKYKDLEQKFEQMQKDLATMQQSGGKGGAAVLAPHFPKPEDYDGSKDVQTFLTQARAYIQNTPTLRGAPAQAMCIGGFLKGKALEWWEPTLREYLTVHASEQGQTTQNVFSDYRNFEQHLRSAFGDPDTVTTAVRKLQNLKQTSSATRYTREFRTLTSGLNLDKLALMTYYYNGLKEDVKDELYKIDRPDHFDEYAEEAIKIDNRNYQRRQEKGKKGTTAYYHRPNDGKPRTTKWSTATSGTTHAGPMEIDLLKKKSPKKGKCYNCGKEGHHANKCRKPKKADSWKPLPTKRVHMATKTISMMRKTPVIDLDEQETIRARQHLQVAMARIQTIITQTQDDRTRRWATVVSQAINVAKVLTWGAPDKERIQNLEEEEEDTSTPTRAACVLQKEKYNDNQLVQNILWEMEAVKRNADSIIQLTMDARLKKWSEMMLLAVKVAESIHDLTAPIPELKIHQPFQLVPTQPTITTTTPKTIKGKQQKRLCMVNKEKEKLTTEELDQRILDSTRAILLLVEAMSALAVDDNVKEEARQMREALTPIRDTMEKSQQRNGKTQEPSQQPTENQEWKPLPEYKPGTGKNRQLNEAKRRIDERSPTPHPRGENPRVHIRIDVLPRRPPPPPPTDWVVRHEGIRDTVSFNWSLMYRKFTRHTGDELPCIRVKGVHTTDAHDNAALFRRGLEQGYRGTIQAEQLNLVHPHGEDHDVLAWILCFWDGCGSHYYQKARNNWFPRQDDHQFIRYPIREEHIENWTDLRVINQDWAYLCNPALEHEDTVCNTDEEADTPDTNNETPQQHMEALEWAYNEDIPSPLPRQGYQIRREWVQDNEDRIQEWLSEQTLSPEEERLFTRQFHASMGLLEQRSGNEQTRRR
jgi:hypothetical protein